MHQITDTEFLAKAASHGLRVNAKYAHNWPRDLSFEQPTEHSVYWIAPSDPIELRRFLGVLLQLLGDGKTLFLWPKCVPLKDVLLNEEIDAITELANATPILSTLGAVVVDQGERDALLNILLPLVQHGWSWPTDVYLVPESFDACVMVDHHEAAHVGFPTAELCAAFVAKMAAHGFPLPEEPPDWTFKSNPDGSPRENG